MPSARNAVTLAGCILISIVCYLNVMQLQTMGHNRIVRAAAASAAAAYLPPQPKVGAHRAGQRGAIGRSPAGVGAPNTPDGAPALLGAGCAADETASAALRAALECAPPAPAASAEVGRCEAKHVDAARAGRLRLIGRVGSYWPLGCDAADADAALCLAVRRAAAAEFDGSRALMLTVVDDTAAATGALPAHVAALRRAGIAARTLFVPLGCRAAALVAASELVAYPSAAPVAAAAAASVAAPALRAAAVRWAVAAAVLRMGSRVLLLDPTVLVLADPFPLFAHDHDYEGMSSGWAEPEAGGYVHGTDDPSMGWSRYVESMRISALAPAFALLQPTAASAALAELLVRRLAAEPPSALGAGTAATAAEPARLVERRLLNEELVLPAANGANRVGARFRVLDPRCFQSAAAVLRAHDRLLSARGLVSAEVVAPPAERGDGGAMAAQQASYMCDVLRAHAGAAPPPAERWRASWLTDGGARGLGALERQSVDRAMQSRAFDSWARMGAAGGTCAPEPVRGPFSQPLNLIASSAATPAEWPVNCAGLEPLCAVVRRAATTGEREVLVAVSNKNIFQMLGAFVDGLKQARVDAFVLVALDDETAAFGASRGVHTYLRKVTARGGGTDNHATSGLKFRILQEFLTVGCSVLLSDVDIIYMDDPFKYLYRDADVEGMSDGWDDKTGYGDADYTTADPALGWLGDHGSVRVFARNSGLFYLQATHEALALMKRMAERMASESVWDQSAYNQELFRPSSHAHAGVGTTMRVMRLECFLNTKVLFRYVRAHPAFLAHRPVSAHVNYHPEKEMRMIDISKFYHGHEPRALDRWNSGEGLKPSPPDGRCEGKVGMGRSDEVHQLRAGETDGRPLARAVAGSGPWRWGAVDGVRFQADGTLALGSPLEPGGGTTGEWGVVNNQWRKTDTIWARVDGRQYLVLFLRHNWSFVAIRCDDETLFYGQYSGSPFPERALY